MSIYYVKENQAIRWQGEIINGVRLPSNIQTLWSNSELLEYGLHRISESPPDVERKRIVNTNVVVKNGKPELEVTYEDIVVSNQEVKDEARRRILEIAPDWKQTNMIARGVELLTIGKENWSQEEAAEVEAGLLMWNRIKEIRLASDELEKMKPIPLDYNDNKWWPVGGA